MGLTRAIVLAVLRTLASLEFQAAGSSTSGFWRHTYMRFLRVKHGRDFALGREVYIYARGNLAFGERCALGSFARIWNYAPITIGDDFLAAGGLTLNSATHDPVTLAPKGEPICVGHRVWCGQNVTILSGVTIGDDVVIGAGSVVTTDIPSNCIAVGVPAKKLKELGRDDKTQLWRWACTGNRS
jgi:maltose O-acetyltransferase